MLMAVGITVSAALTINKKREPLHLSFRLCLAITSTREAFNQFFLQSAWLFIERLGLTIPPPRSNSVLTFREQTLLSDIRTTVLFSTGLAALLFTPLGRWEYMGTLLYLYAAAVLLLCYLSLIVHAKRKAAGVEKKRLVYLIMVCTAAIATYSLPPLFNLIIAGMLYFILIMITHPHLTEFHDLMTRALVILIVTLFTTVIFYLVVGFFGKGPAPPFTLVFMVSFLIIIAVGPFQVILKRLLTRIYPEIKDVFTSPFDIDEKLEREKALLLEKMAPVLAHEIRNPLGSIKGAAQILRSEAESEEQRNLLDVITQEVNRLNRVVSQFLDYARPYAPNLKPQPINAVIEKALAVIETDSLASRIDIQWELHPHLPPVPVDQEQLHQVILNIAINAIEACGGRHADDPDLPDRQRHGDGWGSPSGTRAGNPPRGSQTDIYAFHDQGAGVGLGLAVCQRIIRNHGGRIRVKSIPGQGTIFFIRLEMVR